MNLRFCEAIVLHRRRQKLTCTALAKRAGIGRSSLWRIEKGDTSITLDTLIKVCEALGLVVRFSLEKHDEKEN